jgi:transposase
MVPRVARRSNINAVMTPSRRMRHHFDGIIAAITHRQPNSRVEGVNAGVRLIQRRANGYACLDKLIGMIRRCHGGALSDYPACPQGDQA